MRAFALAWIGHYGYVGVFSLLVLGIVGLPVPDEWLLTFSGYLVFKHRFHFLPMVAASFLGSACGISVSYFLGRSFGIFLLEKYGRYFHIGRGHVDRVHSWFQRMGRWTLLAGYFIPGVRHLTGYLAGTYDLSFSNFALFAYSGALTWSILFVSTGYFLGEGWDHFSEKVHHDVMIAAALALLLLLGTFAIRLIATKNRPSDRV